MNQKRKIHALVAFFIRIYVTLRYAKTRMAILLFGSMQNIRQFPDYQKWCVNDYGGFILNAYTATVTRNPVGGFDEMLKELKSRMDSRDLFIPQSQIIKEKDWFIDAWINNLVYQGDLSATIADSTKAFFKERVTINAH